MRVRDLGALTVVGDTREQPIVGTKVAAMLARLAIDANQRVSVDALMEAAWGDRITEGAASTLTSHIWRLRQVLEPARDRRQPPTVLVNDSDGYRLVCSAATLDSLAFVEATDEVRDLLAAGDARTAITRAEAAMALWRATPYGDFAAAHWARAAVARLEELRGQLQERRLDALVRSGAFETALDDLVPLIADMPLRQSLRALQMLALQSSGRRDDALRVYEETRHFLAEEVGIEPGYELRDLQRRILDNDRSLTNAAPEAETSQRPPEVHLPLALTPLIGRDDVLARLVDLVASHRLVTLIGAAGCGKTRLAVEVARAVLDRYPDGVWFVDLTTVSDPDLVADVVVSTIGFAASPGATPLQDLRRYLQTRRLLLVLDNCEHVLDSVERVIRATLGDAAVPPECGFLVTSREPIGIDGETVWTLGPLGLPDDDPLGDGVPSPAVELFLQRLESAVPTLAIDDDVRARASEIAVAVDGLPLPLELAAARALSHSLDDIAAQVSADPSRLSRVGRGSHDHRATVRSAIEWSHQLLSSSEQNAHRRLSVLPGLFTRDLAGEMVRDEAEDRTTDIDDLLARLVHRSMLVSEGSVGHRHTVFRQLTTVRSHARHALTGAGETQLQLDRRDGWTAALIEARPRLGTHAEADWYRRIDDDYAAVRATLTRQLIDESCADGGRMAYRLTYYWYHREHLVEARRWLQLGEHALAGESPVDSLLARIWRSCVQTVQGRHDLVQPHLADIEIQVRETPSDRLIEVGEALVVLAMGMYVREQPGRLGELHRLLTWVCNEAADDSLALLNDAVGCCAVLVSGRLEAATALAKDVQARAARDQNLMADYVSTAPLIVGALLTGRPADGLPWIDRCLTTHLRLGTGTVGMFIETRANFLAQLGDHALAARTYSVSRTLTRRAGMEWPNRTWTREFLDLTRTTMSSADYERAWREGERLSVAEVVGL